MAFSTTTKHALRWLTGASNVSDVDAGFQALAEDVDAKMAIADSGAFTSRPTSSGGTPGKVGRLYFATDTSQLFFDYGTGWIELAQAPVVAAAFPTTNLVVGQIVWIQTAAMQTKGLSWPFRYKGAVGTYRWEALNPLPWFEKWRGASGGSATTTYAPITAIGGGSVSINAPRAGIYLVRFGIGRTYPSSGTPIQVSYTVPLSEPGDARTLGEKDQDAIYSQWTTTSDDAGSATMKSAECLVTVPVAGDPIWMEQRCGVTVAWPVENPWMEITPVACI